MLPLAEFRVRHVDFQPQKKQNFRRTKDRKPPEPLENPGSNSTEDRHPETAQDHGNSLFCYHPTHGSIMGRGFQKNKSMRGSGGGGGARSFSKGGKFGQKQREQQRRGGMSSGRVAFKPRPAPPLPEALSSLPKFVKKTKFTGRKTGYFFSRGKHGVGYYVDRVQIGAMGDKLKAKLAATLKQPSGASDGSAGESTKAGGAKSTAAGANGKPRSTEEAAKKDKKSPADAAAADTKGVVGKPAAVVVAAAAGAPKLAPRADGSTSAGKKQAAAKAKGDENGSAGGAGGDGASSDDNEDSEEESRGDEEEGDESGGDGDEGGAEGGAEDVRSKAIEQEDENSSSEEEESEDEEGGEDAGANGAAAAPAATKANVEKTAAKSVHQKNVKPAGRDGEEGGDESGNSSDDDEGDEEEDNAASSDNKRESGDSRETARSAVDNDPEGAEGDATEAPPPEDDIKASFESLGVTGPLCEAAGQLGWMHATEIQRQALPLAFEVGSKAANIVVVGVTGVAGVVWLSSPSLVDVTISIQHESTCAWNYGSNV